jgi:alkanesulfonate monooxygenase SsuD/methylene tetrahydromethanopterin reductase-like flavin-dependent oxidoreductase (luciferase family)
MQIAYGFMPQKWPRMEDDTSVYRGELALAERAIELGFSGFWTTEHHFSDFVLTADPLQILGWAAGRFPGVELGSMVVVVPWHDPIRLAEQVATLDQLSGGRLILGLGRGSAAKEYEAFGVELAASRKAFDESVERILSLLAGRDPAVEIRPHPVASLDGRVAIAARSAESLDVAGALGGRLLLIPQKPWAEAAIDIERHARAFREAHGKQPPSPIVVTWVVCDRDPARAEEASRRYQAANYRWTSDYYGYAARSGEAVPGYEDDYYTQRPDEKDAIDRLLEMQVCGTPEICIDKIESIRRHTGAEKMVCLFSFGGMDYAEANESLETFAREVLPRV